MKIKHKRDSVIMLRNVVKLKKDEVAELRKTVTHIEPVRSTSSTIIEGVAVIETNADVGKVRMERFCQKTYLAQCLLHRIWTLNL